MRWLLVLCCAASLAAAPKRAVWIDSANRSELALRLARPAPELDIRGIGLAGDGLAAALARGPLTIIAFGSLTGIAAVMEQHPELVKNIERVVAADYNFARDLRAARVLLSTAVELTLIPRQLYFKADSMVPQPHDDAAVASILALSYVMSRGDMECANYPAKIESGELRVGRLIESTRKVTYCMTLEHEFKPNLLRRFAMIPK